MPNIVTFNSWAAGQETKCVASVVLIAIETSDIGFQRFSTKTVQVNGRTWLGRITQFGGINSQRKTINSSTAGTAAFTVGNTNTSGIDYEGRRCQIFQYFPNSAGSVPLQIFAGVISGPASFDESTGETSFQAQANVHSNQIGFVFQEGEFGANNQQAAGQVWPKVFGKVAHVQGLLVQQQARSRLLFDGGFDFPGDSEDILTAAEAIIGGTTYADYIWGSNLDFNSHRELDVRENIIQVEDASQFTQNEEITIDINGVYFRGEMDSQGVFNISESNVPKFENIAILARDMDDEDAENYFVAWIDTEETLIDHFVTLTLMEGEDVIPDLKNTSEHKVVHQIGNKIWLDRPLRAQGVTDVRMPYTLLDENRSIEEVRLLNRVGLKVEIHTLLEEMKKYQRGVSSQPTEGEEGSGENPMELPGLIQRADFFRHKRNAFWTAPAGALVRQVGNSPDIYVVNDVPSREVTAVYGERTGESREEQRRRGYRDREEGLLTPIPRSYYTINTSHRTSITNGPQRVTTITFNRPLHTYLGQGWSENVYATVDSTLDNNPVNVIEECLSYTNLDTNSSNFNGVRANVRNFPANFVLTERTDAIELAEQVAYQSRIGIINDSERVSLRYLSESRLQDFNVSDRDILFGSVRLSSINHRTIETSMRAIWSQNRQDQEDIYTNNVEAHGFRERTVNFFIYNHRSLVDKSARFWNVRASNIWRTVTFTTYHRLCSVCMFDIINFNTSMIPNTRGVVVGVRNRVVDGLVEITCELPIIQGSAVIHPDYWIPDFETSQPVNPANVFRETDYDGHDVDHFQSLEQVVDNLKELRAKQKVHVVVKSVDGDAAIVDVHPLGIDNPPSEVDVVATITAPDNNQPGVNIASQDRNGNLYLDNTAAISNCRWVRIVGIQPINEFENRWEYTGTAQDLKARGTFADSEPPEGESEIEQFVFYSIMESMNTGTGIEGSGDNIADFPPGVNIRPLGMNAIVRICQHIDCFGSPVWLLENTPNNAGGSCE